MTRIIRRLAAFSLVGIAFLGIATTAFSAPNASQKNSHNGILVVQVQGLIDPPNATFIKRTIHDAERAKREVVVFQLDSPGALNVNVNELVSTIRNARVPIAVWVGPSGAQAEGGAALIALAAPIAVISNGSHLGPVYPVRLDKPGAVSRQKAVSTIAGFLSGRPGSVNAAAKAVTSHRLSASNAQKAGLTNQPSPIIGEFIIGLDGMHVQTKNVDVRLSTAKVVGKSTKARQQPNQEVIFTRLGFGDSMLHKLISPSVAYLFLIVGLALMVFEFFTVSIGLAGAIGAGAFASSFVGFSHLPVEWWAVALIVLGVFGFTIDVQVGGLGVWTFIGFAAVIAGSLFLYGGSSRLDPAWWIYVMVIGGLVLFMLGGMTAMLRSRFTAPTIGREALVGTMGDAEVDVNPDGVVMIQGSRWTARTNRATPIKAGARIRVTAIEGFTLEVEPETGGAKDFHH